MTQIHVLELALGASVGAGLVLLGWVWKTIRKEEKEDHNNMSLHAAISSLTVVFEDFARDFRATQEQNAEAFAAMNADIAELSRLLEEALANDGADAAALAALRAQVEDLIAQKEVLEANAATPEQVAKIEAVTAALAELDTELVQDDPEPEPEPEPNPDPEPEV